MFHKLKIKELRRETADCVSVAFEVPETLRKTFAFKQGQHLVFRSWHEGAEIRRSYSICSCPFDGELRVAVKQIAGGVFSSHINERARVGDEMEVMAPQGRFYTELEPHRKKRYVAVAAGSGITPIISIVKTVLRAEPQSEFVLFFGNRNKGSIIFKEEIEALKNLHMERLSVYHILSRERADSEILSGRIDRRKMDFFLDHLLKSESIDEVFLCGPEEMIFSARDAFQAAGVASKNIHYELFYSADAEARKMARHQQSTTPATEGPISKIRLKLDASTLEFDLPYEGDSILDAALKNGADLPYSCKGGVCATCKCKLEEGDVVMDVNYSLEADELERGFILACQSHPSSAEVVVNFDIK